MYFLCFPSLPGSDFARWRVAIDRVMERNVLKTPAYTDSMEKVIKILICYFPGKYSKIIFIMKIDNVLSHCNISF